MVSETPTSANHGGGVTKAVIPAAGLGTRFLPFTKAVPKEMLPIVDRPAIDYVVQEAVEAGIEDILIVTSRNKSAIEDHFDRSPELEAHLLAKDKTEEAEQIKAIAQRARISYVRQGQALGLGHAISLARHFVGVDPFMVMSPDNVFHPTSSVVSTMIALYQRHRCAVIGLEQVPLEQISHYGSVEVEPVEDKLFALRQVVEKPSPRDAPSNLAVMGRYLFTPAVFDQIEATEPGLGGEYQIADAMNLLIGQHRLLGAEFTGVRYDTGDKLDYLRAVVELALERPDIGPTFRALLASIMDRNGI